MGLINKKITMPLSKMLKRPRCKGLVMWDDKTTNCRKCNLYIISQGQEIADPFRDCGVMIEDANEILLITARKKN